MLSQSVNLNLQSSRQIKQPQVNYILHWVLQPTSVRGARVVKQVAKSSGFQLDITTKRSQNTGWWLLDHSLLDVATNTGLYFLNKRQIFAGCWQKFAGCGH